MPYRWKRRLYGLALLAALVWLGTGFAFTQSQGLRNFTDINELRRLIDLAREAGFSEQEIRAITIQEEGQVINVWEYLQELERQQRQRKQTEQRQIKDWLTVREIFDLMDQQQAEDLDRIRDQLLVVK